MCLPLFGYGLREPFLNYVDLNITQARTVAWQCAEITFNQIAFAVYFGSVDNGNEQIGTNTHATTLLIRIPSKRTALSGNERIDRRVRRVVFGTIYQIEKQRKSKIGCVTHFLYLLLSALMAGYFVYTRSGYVRRTVATEEASRISDTVNGASPSW
jgi:hypothetical protein